MYEEKKDQKLSITHDTMLNDETKTPTDWETNKKNMKGCEEQKMATWTEDIYIYQDQLSDTILK